MRQAHHREQNAGALAKGGPPAGTVTDEYVYFDGSRIAHRDSGLLYLYANDHLGSARAVIQSGSTSLTYDADFYPFGGERPVIIATDNNYKFTGKERDFESGLDDFGARYYSSPLGRFVSTDWSAAPEPVPYANFTNPQTLNLYAMVHDNPETFADLDGHCYPWCTMAVGALVGAITGGGAEIIAQKIKNPHQSINWKKVEHATEGGAVAGAITGLAGPEAGLAAKAAAGVTGSVVGGGVERAANGEKIMDGKAIVVDAAAGAIGTLAEKGASKLIPPADPMKTVEKTASKEVLVLKSDAQLATENTVRNATRQAGTALVNGASDATRRENEQEKKNQPQNNTQPQNNNEPH